MKLRLVIAGMVIVAVTDVDRIVNIRSGDEDHLALR